MLVKELVKQHPQTDWGFEYTPESFSTTELDFSRHICDAVTEIWQPTPHDKMIINLPSTVECSTPNVYADQIEWMSRKLARRDSIIISVHPHNDRGTAVASAEMAVMAGADRVEGCLFGNGERTGNVDLVTLALNLYTQGVHPGLDFSDIDAVRQVVENATSCRCIRAIRMWATWCSRRFRARTRTRSRRASPAAAGRVVGSAVSAIDPADLGRNYDAVIRVNSQSGKGGMAYLLEQDYGLALPRRLQIEFSRAVQAVADASGREIAAKDITRSSVASTSTRQRPTPTLRTSWWKTAAATSRCRSTSR